MVLLISIIAIAWVAASIIGTQAYFRGELTKTIHERNWNSQSFDQLAKSFTGKETNYLDRVPAYYFDPQVTSQNS